MPTPEPAKDDLLDAIAVERRYWNALVAAMTRAGLTNESDQGENAWTFRDVAVHLNGWRGWTLARLKAALDETPPPSPPWPSGLDEESEADVDTINAWLAGRAENQPLTDVLAETDAQFDALSAIVAAMPDENLLTPGRFPWLGDLPVGPALLGYSYTHLHIEHDPELRSWLRDATGIEPALPPAPPTFGYED